MTIRLLAGCALAALVGLEATAAPPPALANLLAQYAQGEYPSALAGIHALVGRYDSRTPERLRQGGGPILHDLQAIAPAFVLDHPEDPRRRLVVAAFALEIAHARGDDTLESRLALTAWACGVASHASRSDSLRRWYLASVAVMEEMGAWTRLGGGDPAVKGPFVTSDDELEFRTGHLTHARAAFPDEPRWRLAKAEVDEAATASVGFGTSWSGPDRETLPAAARPERIAKVRAALAQFEALTADARLAPDADLHAGYLHLRLGDWDEAIAALERARRLAREPAGRYDAELLIGWARAQQGSRTDAISRYRAALLEAPGARTASVLLGAALGEAGEMTEAARAFDAAWHVEGAARPIDPWPRFSSGDGLRAPALLADLREALR